MLQEPDKQRISKYHVESKIRHSSLHTLKEEAEDNASSKKGQLSPTPKDVGSKEPSIEGQVE